jgi:hypothetical protein
MDTHLSTRRICASAMSRISQFTDFIPAKTKGWSNEVYVIHSSQLILFYNAWSLNFVLLFITLY